MQIGHFLRHVEELGSTSEFLDFSRSHPVHDTSISQQLEESLNTAASELEQERVKSLIARVRIVRLLGLLQLDLTPTLSEEDFEHLASFLAFAQYEGAMTERDYVINLVRSNLSRSEHQEYWAIFQLEYAQSLVQKPNIKKAEAEEARQAALAANEVFQELDQQDLLAASYNSLGAIFKSTAVAGNDKDIKMAIAYHQQALQYFASQEPSRDLMMTHYNLGGAYLLLAHTAEPNNASIAIEHLNKALDLCWDLGLYQDRARTLVSLAKAHSLTPARRIDKAYLTALAYYRQVLDMTKDLVDGVIWATANYNIGGLLYQTRHSRNSLRLREAIFHFSEAIDSSLAINASLEVAESRLAKAKAILELVDPRHEELSEALALLNNSLAFYKSVNEIHKIADCKNTLGILYTREWTGGDRLKARDCFSEAARLFKIAGNEESALSSLVNAANVSTRGLGDDRAKEREEGIAIYRNALATQESKGLKEGAAITLLALGNALVKRSLGKRSDNVAEAINCFSRALDYYEEVEDRDSQIMLHTNLGNAYKEHRSENFTEDIEKSIEHFKHALKLLDSRSAHSISSSVKSGLARAYSTRIMGDPVENHETALQYATQALEEADLEAHPTEWAFAQASLGIIYLYAPFGAHKSNLRTAIAHYENSLDVFTREHNPEMFAEIHVQLGDAYARDYANLFAVRQSIWHYETALEVFEREHSPTSCAWTHLKLGGIALREQHLFDDSDGGFKRALTHYRNSLDFFNRIDFPVDWAILQVELGNLYLEHGPGDHEAILTAVDFYKRALEVYNLDHFPNGWTVCNTQICRAYFRLGKDDLALYHGLEVIEHYDNLLTYDNSETGKLTAKGGTEDIFSIVAYCLVSHGEVEKALEILDKGMARVLSDSLALLDLDLGKLNDEEHKNIATLLDRIRLREERLRQTEWSAEYNAVGNSELIRHNRENLNLYLASLRERYPHLVSEQKNMISQLADVCDSNTVLIVPIVTVRGTVIVLAFHDEAGTVRIQSIPIETFTLEDVSLLLSGKGFTPGILNAQALVKTFGDERFFALWQNILEETTRELWDLFVEKWITQVKQLDRTNITIVSHGVLQLLPLHAAWRKIDTEKEFLADDFVITYAPSIRALSISKQRLKSLSAVSRSALAAINPTGDLPYAEREGELVRLYFDQYSSVPSNGKAVKSILKTAGNYSYLHFACHGYFDLENKWSSGLVLGQDEFLSLNDITSRLRLPNTRLIVLSACETGISDIREAPSELIGLPAGFLQAGVPAVIGTLWAVDDYATSLLVDRFYYHHIQEEMPPSKALSAAQRWLRQLTLSKLNNDTFSKTRLSSSEYEDALNILLNSVSSEKPYEHPYYWAAFYLTGV